ncbi:MAG: ribose 1,5-bisphosphate isomerase [Thermoplasmatota archaeon]
MTDHAISGIGETAEKITNMEIRGAGKIGRAASSALADLARKWKGDDREEFISAIRKGAKELQLTRPSAISLRNSILLTLKGCEKGESVDEIRDILVKQSEDFTRSSLEAVQRIAEIGMKRIPAGSVVLTHCNSNAALSVIEKAYGDGRVDGVICTESRPWRQGHITSRRLAGKGIPVTMIVDSAVRYFIRDVDVVCVGADTVAANGAVINKIGTSQVALASHEHRIPFLVCAETLKFSRETLLGSLVKIEERGADEVADPLKAEDFPGVTFRNPVFDATPPEYIDAIVTEVGVVSPYLATEIIRDMFPGAGTLSSKEREIEFKWV